jgi:hypothetical protein
MQDVAHEYDEWVCVFQKGGYIYATPASRDASKEDEIVYCKAETLEEVETILRGQHYAPVIRLPPALGVFILYQPLRETKWGIKR